MTRRNGVATTAILLAVLGFSCSKEGEQAPPNSLQFNASVGQAGQGGMAPGGAQAGQPGYGQPTVGQGGQPSYGELSQAGGQVGQAGQAAAANPIGAILSNPQMLQQIVTGALAAGAAQMGGVTGGELGPVEQGIKMKAGQVAKGMKPVGPLMSARLKQGEHAQAPVQLEAGPCYAVVGFGGSGIFKYQLNLLTAVIAGVQPQVVAQSPDTASDPVMGGPDSCIRTAIPMAVNVDMFAVFGQGMVGAQLYKK
jgi:hypothetical protein